QVEATVNELILAFGRMLLRAPAPEPVHLVAREQVSAADRVGEIRRLLKKKGRLLFSDLVAGGPASRIFLVVTLVALLEMARSREIVVEQDELFSEIWIARRRGRKTGAGRSKDPGGPAGTEEEGKQSGDPGPDRGKAGNG
ncbi:MAG: segregation/condensation protein A, partial [Candidatus Glassbacteria bacterium]|nr:segregation/condensation protein A [Candidatus Glassbacteria bacterium]